MKKSLPEPPDIKSADQSVELLSGWLIDGKLQCAVFPVWKDNPEKWGILLADTIGHLSDAIAQKSGESASKIKESIFQALQTEIKNPSNELEGDFFSDENDAAG